ncbi:hypothetical protein BGX38DRAFT_1089512 [Terfezia claveryi]|nr:hypothetical protein BGX38DRAFT_1089512 [Terfezia claveryi]
MTDKQQWANGFFSCCSTPGICCLAIWCPCILYGRTHHRLEHGSTKGYCCCNWNVGILSTQLSAKLLINPNAVSMGLFRYALHSHWGTPRERRLGRSSISMEVVAETTFAIACVQHVSLPKRRGKLFTGLPLCIPQPLQCLILVDLFSSAEQVNFRVILIVKG